MVSTSDAARSLSRSKKENGMRIALVPTMGCLHEGHLSLLRTAAARADFVFCSIYVNESQFAPGEDYQSYPRRLEADLEKLRELGCVNCSFTPKAMYAQGTCIGGGEDGHQTWVTVERLQQPLCGKSRPIFFRGVATVVAKLLNIVEPDVVFFGMKDYQQYCIIRQMAIELDFPVEVVACPIVRETDGLAMSSRNLRLSPTNRERAPVIYKALLHIVACLDKMRDGKSEVICLSRLLSQAAEQIERETGGAVEYMSSLNSSTLVPITEISVVSSSDGADKGGVPIVIATAVVLDGVRLIDNVVWPRLK